MKEVIFGFSIFDLLNNCFNSIGFEYFLSSGIPDKWSDHIKHAIILNSRFSKKNEKLHFAVAVSLEDMQSAFLILGIGWIICSIVFLAEIIF